MAISHQPYFARYRLLEPSQNSLRAHVAILQHQQPWSRKPGALATREPASPVFPNGTTSRLHVALNGLCVPYHSKCNQLAVYTTYIPLIYCLLRGYIIPTTLYRNLKNPLKIARTLQIVGCLLPMSASQTIPLLGFPQEVGSKVRISGFLPQYSPFVPWGMVIQPLIGILIVGI